MPVLPGRLVTAAPVCLIYRNGDAFAFRLTAQDAVTEIFRCISNFLEHTPASTTTAGVIVVSAIAFTRKIPHVSIDFAQIAPADIFGIEHRSGS